MSKGISSIRRSVGVSINDLGAPRIGWRDSALAGMDVEKQLYVTGVSFRNAPLAVREVLAFSPEEAEKFLRDAVGRLPGLEAVVLSACNRTEFYLAAPTDPIGPFLRLLREFRPDAPILRDDGARCSCSGDAAVRHLFRVASGVDSAVFGDTQIVRRLREAVTVASKAGAFGECIQRVMTYAGSVGKRARTETDIGCGAASVGSALTDTGVPRSVGPTAKLEVWNIDSVEERRVEMLARRQAAVPLVEQIVEEEMRNWTRWISSRPLERVLKNLCEDIDVFSDRQGGELAARMDVEFEDAKRMMYRNFHELVFERTRASRKLP